MEDKSQNSAASELAEILNRLGKTFELQFEDLDVDGRKLEILGISNMRAHLDGLLAAKKIRDPIRDLPLWAKVWPAALVLGRFLRRQEPEGKSMLELGAGMGICSLLAAGYGFDRIVLSEANPVALEFARANVLRNGLEDKIQTTSLKIGAASKALENEQFDILAASELLYLDDLHRPLLKFINKRLRPGGKALFCTDVARLKPNFRKLAARAFAVQEGHVGLKSAEDGEEKRRLYNILILERK